MSLTPLHTRALSLRLRWAGDSQVRVEARLLDLRKRAIVPLGTVLREPGVVHDMSVSVWIDVRSRSITRVDPSMATFPYLPSPETGGETCTGRIDDVQRLVGVELASGYGDALTELIGGARGCFHVFTLLRLIGPIVVCSLDGDHVGQLIQRPEALLAGERLLSASIAVDGFQDAAGQLRLCGTHTQIQQRGGTASPGDRERLCGGLEAAIELATRLPEMTLAAAAGRSRTLGPGVWEAGEWTDEPRLAALAGVPVRKGFSARVGEILGDAAGAAPLTQLVFMTAPVVMQCMPSLLAGLRLAPRAGQGTGTAPDSCHMWRSEGPLHRWVQEISAPGEET